MDITGIIKQATGKTPIEMPSNQELWLSWYKNKVAKFHEYSEYNGNNNITKKRRTLGVCKKSCEDWANLLLNEKTEVAISGDGNQDKLNDLLQKIGFWVKGNKGVELSFALGNGAFVESYTEAGKPKFQFVNATKMYPISVEDDEVTECAFVNINSNNVVIQIYYKDADGYYFIRTLKGEKQDNDLTMHFGDIDKDYITATGTQIPFFQCIRPFVANNDDIDSPMGISVYANAIDEAEGVDLAYDGLCTENKNGKLRTFVDKRLTKYVDGSEKPVFDNSDDFFYQIGNGEEQTNKPFEFYAPTLRSDAYFNSVNNALNLFSIKVGFGTNHYRFNQSGLSTATQVISDNQEKYQSTKKHEILLNDALVGAVRALVYICNHFGDGEYNFVDEDDLNIEIKFDDSVIEDKEAQKMADRQDVSMGVMSKAEFRSKWYGEDLETATKVINEIQASQPSLPTFFSGE